MKLHRIDLTEDGIVSKSIQPMSSKGLTSDRQLTFKNLFLDNGFRIPVDLKPIETETHKMREFGFEFLGDIKDPFFLGEVSEFKNYRHYLEGDLLESGYNICKCYGCGKTIDILDEDSIDESIFQAMPIMCKKCFSDYKGEFNIDQFMRNLVSNERRR